MNVIENIAKVKELEEVANSHLCGGTFSYIDGKVRVVFNENYCGLHGIQVSLTKGKINALLLLINKMDELYNKEFGWSSFHKTLKSV